MKGQTIQRIQPNGRKSSYGAVMWEMLPVCMTFAGGMTAYISFCGNQAPALLLPFLMSLLSLGCMEAGKILGRKQALFRLLVLLPWGILLLLTGIRGVNGQLVWMNLLISRWNQIHQAGFKLLPVGNSGTGLWEAALWMTVLQAELVWFLVYGGHKLGVGVYSLFWICLLLAEQEFSPMACALLLTGMLGSCMAGAYMEMSNRMRAWMLATAGILCVCAVLTPQQEMDGIRTARETTQKQLHEFRYGADLLPGGDIRAADRLRKESGTIMTVQSGQEKELYLRAFVGGVLEKDGWKALPDSAYGGEASGILKWLEAQGFDPLTQPAQYYALGDEAERPENNGIEIYVKEGSRYYFYAPASLNQVIMGESREKKDQNLLSRGIVGQRNYKVEEISGSRPSELTIVSDWVRSPENGEQKQYSDAEAVYRDFVYRHYTTVDDGLEELMQTWFWEDYETESDGIYSAISHIRKKLAEGAQYTDNPKAAPEGKDPVRWFLTESREGNAVQYASAAVQALRYHGVPARYVEGYHIPASDLAGDGTAEVTGQDAHAWAEVYFDGVGWLPLDVTPGYYYDALRLQQLVEMPDAVHRTAALEDSEKGADEINNMDSSAGSSKAEDKENGVLTGRICKGLAAILVMFCTMVFSTAELLRGIQFRKLERALRGSESGERAVQVEILMFAMLRLLGIDASLGWAADEVDQELAGRFRMIETGEYKRASQLLEKAVYGEAFLEPFEERTLYSFLDKLAEAARSTGLAVRLRIRYLIFYKK